MECPRCGFADFNTFKLKRSLNGGYVVMPVNKCLNKGCGFLWIADKDVLGMSKKELEYLFIKDLRSYGKKGTGP